MSQNKIVVYTALFGNYDHLQDPPLLDGCDYVCFTDLDDLCSERYCVVRCQSLFLDPARDNRMYKILPHRYFGEYEYSLYMDASLRVRELDVEELIIRYLAEKDLALFLHGKRSCLYEEYLVCSQKSRDHAHVMGTQIERYRRLGFPEKWGLTENAFLLRRHNTPDMVRFAEAWWKEIEMGSKRDQLSFAYVSWLQGLQFSILPGTVRHNNFLEVEPHLVSQLSGMRSSEDENRILRNKVASLEYELGDYSNRFKQLRKNKIFSLIDIMLRKKLLR